MRILVTGRVQGVGFRHFTLVTATGMGIGGEVWNTRSGEVEVLAEHPDQKVLDALAEALADGPGHVANVSTQSIAEARREGFKVGETR